MKPSVQAIFLFVYHKLFVFSFSKIRRVILRNWFVRITLVNSGLVQGIELYDVHYGFYLGQGTDMAIMETKVHIQLAR